MTGVKNLGVPNNRVVIWDRNGIEHVYPRAILVQYFGDFQDLTIADDEVSANGITIRKGELSAFVVGRLTRDTPLPSEFRTNFLDPLGAVLT